MKKIEIAKRALIARINRKLAQEDLQLRKNRSFGRGNLGEYYFLNTKTGNIDEKTHWTPSEKTLEKFAREIGALADHEKLGEE
jgi:hypothetical protein